MRPGRLIGAIVLAGASVRAHGQSCASGRPTGATIGIGRYECVTSSSCMLGHAEYVFQTEPTVWGIDPYGPSADALRDGDVLVAVDGLLITTRAAGERMANLNPEGPITLRVRRQGVEHEYRIKPARGCVSSTLVVVSPAEVSKYGSAAVAMDRIRAGRANDRVPKPSKSDLGPVDFGMVLDCGDCAWRERDGVHVFETKRPLIIRDVAAGGPAAQAHLAPDDLILEVEHIPITDARAGQLLGALTPGDHITFGVWRRGQMRSVAVTPREHPKENDQ